MKKILIVLSIISLNACSQTTKSNSKTINHTKNDTTMDLSKITNNTVKTAIEALQTMQNFMMMEIKLILNRFQNQHWDTKDLLL